MKVLKKYNFSILATDAITSEEVIEVEECMKEFIEKISEDMPYMNISVLQKYAFNEIGLMSDDKRTIDHTIALSKQKKVVSTDKAIEIENGIMSMENIIDSGFTVDLHDFVGEFSEYVPVTKVIRIVALHILELITKVDGRFYVPAALTELSVLRNDFLQLLFSRTGEKYKDLLIHP